VHIVDLLKKGVIWRIGSGSKLKIFHDNWMPRSDGMKVEGRRGNSCMKWVSELINQLTRTWDELAVCGCYLPRDVEAILMRVNSTNVLDEGLRIGGRGSWMNLKVESVKQGIYRK
jgi:hypothetical protein